MADFGNGVEIHRVPGFVSTTECDYMENITHGARGRLTHPSLYMSSLPLSPRDTHPPTHPPTRFISSRELRSRIVHEWGGA